MHSLILISYLAAINVVSFRAFGSDKARARRGAQRYSEAGLLRLAVVGGSVGAKAGQRYFRHKTRKEPFRSLLNGIIAVQILLAGALVVDMTTDHRLSRVIAMSGEMLWDAASADLMYHDPAPGLPRVRRGGGEV